MGSMSVHMRARDKTVVILFILVSILKICAKIGIFLFEDSFFSH